MTNMGRWERRLRGEGLGPKVGRRTLHVVPFDERLHAQHGLVSSLYALAAPGDYYDDAERDRRNRVALKLLIDKHGPDEVWLRVRRAQVPKRDETTRARILDTLAGLA